MVHSRNRVGWDRRKQKTLRDRGRTGASCPVCGKVEYVTRAAAKTAIRARHPGEKLHAYRCHGDRWHIGHQSPDITYGVITRSDAYRPVLHARPEHVI